MLKGKMNFIAGVVVGTLMVSGAMATELLVNKSTHNVLVNGEKVNIEAYNINGHNFFQLKDIGKNLDFSVVWEEESQSVLIDTTKPYEEQVSSSEVKEDIETKENIETEVIKVPQTGESFCPAEGTVIETEKFINGKFTGEKSTFTITKAKPEEAELPTATCDWTQFPEIELPEAVAKDFDNGRVSILNLHETRRMQLELYNLIGENPQTWENGTIAKYKDGSNKVSISFEIEGEPQMMYPYRASEIRKVFEGSPCREWHIVAYDVYKDGKFLHTAYYLE